VRNYELEHLQDSSSVGIDYVFRPELHCIDRPQDENGKNLEQSINRRYTFECCKNIYASLQAGVATFDASVAGLGGCPYAAGASGNVATEDVVYMLDGLGVETGIRLDALVETSAWICERLGRSNGSKVSLARGACRR